MRLGTIFFASVLAIGCGADQLGQELDDAPSPDSSLSGDGPDDDWPSIPDPTTWDCRGEQVPVPGDCQIGCCESVCQHECEAVPDDQRLKCKSSCPCRCKMILVCSPDDMGNCE